MLDLISGIIIIPIMCGFTYGLIRQYEETIIIIKSKIYSRKCLVGHVLCCISYTLFLLAYMANVVLALFGKGSIFPRFDFTSLICSLSIIVFLISRYAIIPRSQQ